jgi:hypothetical protein
MSNTHGEKLVQTRVWDQVIKEAHSSRQLLFDDGRSGYEQYLAGRLPQH